MSYVCTYLLGYVTNTGLRDGVRLRLIVPEREENPREDLSANTFGAEPWTLRRTYAAPAPCHTAETLS